MEVDGGHYLLDPRSFEWRVIYCCCSHLCLHARFVDEKLYRRTVRVVVALLDRGYYGYKSRRQGVRSTRYSEKAGTSLWQGDSGGLRNNLNWILLQMKLLNHPIEVLKPVMSAGNDANLRLFLKSFLMQWQVGMVVDHDRSLEIVRLLQSMLCTVANQVVMNCCILVLVKSKDQVDVYFYN